MIREKERGIGYSSCQLEGKRDMMGVRRGRIEHGSMRLIGGLSMEKTD